MLAKTHPGATYIGVALKISIAKAMPGNRLALLTAESSKFKIRDDNFIFFLILDVILKCVLNSAICKKLL